MGVACRRHPLPRPELKSQIGYSHACYSFRHQMVWPILCVHDKKLSEITVYCGSLTLAQPRKLFFISRSLSIISDSVVPPVALLEITELTSILHAHQMHREANLQNGTASESHEYIPFLLVPDGAISLGDFVRVHQFLKAGQHFVIRVNGFGEG